MLNYAPPAATPLSQLRKLAEVVGSREKAERMNYLRAELELVHAEYEEELAGYEAQLANLPPWQEPSNGEGGRYARESNQLREELAREAQAGLIMAHSCFHLPLDHRHGEQLNPPGDSQGLIIEHWLSAPGNGGRRGN